MANWRFAKLDSVPVYREVCCLRDERLGQHAVRSVLCVEIFDASNGGGKDVGPTLLSDSFKNWTEVADSSETFAPPKRTRWRVSSSVGLQRGRCRSPRGPRAINEGQKRS